MDDDAKRNVILCIGSNYDPHITAVENKVKRLSNHLKFVLFNPLRNNHYIDISLGDKRSFSCVITVEEERISSDCVRSVWHRWQPEKFHAGDSMYDTLAKDFAIEEWKNVILSLATFVPDAVWMNPLLHNEQIKSKALQLRLAQECGLKIPLSKVTNDAATVQSLFSKPNLRLVSKPLTSLVIPPNKRIRPKEISNQYVIASSSRISVFPGIFQEMITDGKDICVVIVGDAIFAAKVATKGDLQVGKNEQNPGQERSLSCKIPEIVENCLLSFHKRAGLVLGVYNLLEVEGKEFFFLDCDPCGTWLYLEECIGLDISKAIAKTLAGSRMNQKELPYLKQFENP